MRIIFATLFIFIYASSDLRAQTTRNVSLIITPKAGDKSLFIDSTYSSPNGEKYTIKKLKFFISEIALAKPNGEEITITPEKNANGIFLIDFSESNYDAGHGKQSYKIEFKAPAGDYSDIRFTVGVPRKFNHLDPTLASPPLDLGKDDMYWAWNSGYIFLLAEGKRVDFGNDFFHFAIGGDTRSMPLYFGNLFNVKPLLKIEQKKTTQIAFTLDFNKIFIGGDGSHYSLKEEENAIVHGGHQADALRNNFIKAFEFSSSKITDKNP